jgi:hypothetical protein
MHGKCHNSLACTVATSHVSHYSLLSVGSIPDFHFQPWLDESRENRGQQCRFLLLCFFLSEQRSLTITFSSELYSGVYMFPFLDMPSNYDRVLLVLVEPLQFIITASLSPPVLMSVVKTLTASLVLVFRHIFGRTTSVPHIFNAYETFLLGSLF